MSLSSGFLTILRIFAPGAALLSGSLFANADCEIKLIPAEYDFGTFNEEAGPVEGSVKLVNIGSSPTYIRNVRPSCGCTSARFFEGEIAPGDTAWVAFTYDPVKRPGGFLKTVKIYMGDDSKRFDVKIKGTVIGTPETLSLNYPFRFGKLCLSDSVVNLGNIPYGTTRHLFINAYNLSSDSVAPSFAPTSSALDVDVYPKMIAPGNIASLSFYLNSRMLPKDSVGPIKFTVPLFVDNHLAGNIILNATISETPAGVSAGEFSSVPLLLLDRNVVALEDVTPGRKRSFSFRISNSGSSDLRIFNISSNSQEFNAEVEVNKFPTTLKPGAGGVVKGWLKIPENASAPLRIPLEIFSNDPLHPRTSLHLTILPSKHN